MKILLIEDNKDISKSIKEYFELDWSVVNCFYDWASWLDEAVVWKYDIILLDLMLPGIDWLTVSRKLKWKISTPIIITTAKESIDVKLEWFENWVVDYIVKPFDLRELEARIKVTLNTNNSVVVKWDYELDFENRIFKKLWEEVKVWKTEFQLLNYLYENKSRVVSRTEIIENIWWEKAIFESDAKLDVYISNIRNKFWKDILTTSKWFWYKFNLES
jgi:two-component system response regulator CiaR